MGHSDKEKPASGADRRQAVRVVYETVAMVAEYDGSNFPAFSSFWEVQTKDLSATGIGFLSSRRPETELLLLMLGNPQANPIFIEARLVHCVPTEVAGSECFRVGCLLLRRMTR